METDCCNPSENVNGVDAQMCQLSVAASRTPVESIRANVQTTANQVHTSTICFGGLASAAAADPPHCITFAPYPYPVVSPIPHQVGLAGQIMTIPFSVHGGTPFVGGETQYRYTYHSIGSTPYRAAAVNEAEGTLEISTDPFNPGFGSLVVFIGDQHYNIPIVVSYETFS